MEPTIVMLLGALLILALIGPKIRLSRLVPVVGILLGFFLAARGFLPTLGDVFDLIRGFLRQLPIDL
ncbi:ABC transporter permease [Parafrankia sp. BMG5.11]|uniref:ABC transporter permease n=1 Tax=Parafrankia sp. BMG5.11 TaxID=222540 RepID=UPI00103C54F3|nr:ABC transporter permease [Parafrankia sp. BMG5.11]TCJ35904.1 ABC transporter permease [Parafrankia sp. BMG5.11]